MGSYTVESSRLAYEGIVARVRLDDVRMPDGAVRQREVVEQAPAVAIIAIDGDGLVILLSQYRHPLGGRLVELPAGKLDVEGEEEPLAAAQRELAEEAGLAADSWELLTYFHNSGGWTDERTLVYLATGLRETPPPAGFQADAEEADLEILRVPLAAALGLIRSGEITDAKTMIGLLLVAQERYCAVRERAEQPWVSDEKGP
ncbi:MAG: NUDIX domain-containing protein [Egibacteraceae bacterium]